MNLLTKASLGAVLAALLPAGAAHATSTLDVTPTVTPPAAGSNAPYQYSYTVTPQVGNSANEQSLNFMFTDLTVAYVSNTGPLSTVTSNGPGEFTASGPSGTYLDPGNSETFVFTSLDAPGPTGSGLTILSTHPTGTDANPDAAFGVEGPAAVPEASTTVSMGLLLTLGLGGVLVAARRRKQAA